MGKTSLGQEVWVTASDKIGTFAKVTEPLSEAKVNIWGLCAWSDTTAKTGTFMFVTDNNAKACDVLKKAGYTPETKEVVVTSLEDMPGTCWNAVTKLAQAGVDINYWYYTTCGGCPARIVFSTKDNRKAVSVLG